MRKLNEARECIAGTLAQHKTPAIALTFGKDSMLVAALVLQQAPETTCIWLNQLLTKEQRKFPEQVIVEWSLNVWSCGVQSWAVIDDKYATCTYALNSSPLTTVHDLIHSEAETCILQKRPRFSPPINLPVDLFFTGWRKSDEHELMKYGYAPRINDTTVSSPLAGWTEDEVWEATFALNIPHNHDKYNGNPFADPDNIIANLTCLRQGECTCQR